MSAPSPFSTPAPPPPALAIMAAFDPSARPPAARPLYSAQHVCGVVPEVALHKLQKNLYLKIIPKLYPDFPIASNFQPSTPVLTACTLPSSHGAVYRMLQVVDPILLCNGILASRRCPFTLLSGCVLNSREPSNLASQQGGIFTTRMHSYSDHTNNFR